MPLARIQSRALLGVESPPVEVEVHVANGLPAFHIVGLPEAAVRESRDRVRAALLQCGFDFPNRRLTVNLAPADLPKDSGRFDLAIAVGILVATEQAPADRTRGRIFVGELSLSGELRPVRGAMATALSLATAQSMHTQAPKPAHAIDELILPAGNAAEVTFVPGLSVRIADTLMQVFQDLSGVEPLNLLTKSDSPKHVNQHAQNGNFSDIKGLGFAKRALEVAAAGAHNLLMVGPPGAGKSMLAQRLPGILPIMTDHEALESGAITSLAGKFSADNWRQRAFRAPHHSASSAALIGGGQRLRPGEISLAHHGVLFLDELPEFGPATLDCLREPLETGRIALSRAAQQLELPARFQLIAAMNPCPCGHHGNDHCRCTPDQIKRYQGRLSGPLLDRLDLQIWVQPVCSQELAETTNAETSEQIHQRVIAARQRQIERQATSNATMNTADVDTHCELPADALQLMHKSAQRLRWSGRVFHRIQKIARTISDLDECTHIQANHVAEAVSFRRAINIE